MLRVIQSSSATGAKGYYARSDYYLEGQELAGRWGGKGAERLGLQGPVSKEAWDALCDNRHPETGRTLTPRQKQNRRIGYDFNFHVPKSVSIAYGMTRDERILDAFRESVGATMQDMEAEMKTRVRSGGRDEDRTTGNMAWGNFIHFTSRPVNGVPDPHLHAHCFVFNSTWDATESRWKAGQFADLKRDAPYFEAVFHSRLARRMEELGLPVERTKKGWELQDVPRSAIARFSRRTALIEEKAREKGITDPDEKSGLGAKTREKKNSHLSLESLREEWASRLAREEMQAIGRVIGRIGDRAIGENTREAGNAVTYAIQHCFERTSVMPERKVLTMALKHAVGAAGPETVELTLQKERLIGSKRDGQRLVTTKEVLAEERAMTRFGRDGRGTCRPMAPGPHHFAKDGLSGEQRRAVEHVLHSNDRVVLVRGAAGTGKTTLMRETVAGIESGGRRVFTFAPSADASRGVLRQEGFLNAETVARLLKDERMQEATRGQVIWIDEAGLMGTRAMAGVFALADRMDARVVLSGDRHQHGSVERGAALRLLEEEAGLVPAEVREIRRQRGAYKEAVRALSEGRTEQGFKQLDKLGWIREATQGERYKMLAMDYVAAVKEGKTAIIVSPTHVEGEWISDEVRSQLKQAGKLGTGERRFVTLENANFTEAERRDELNYEPGDVVVFHQNAKGFAKGQQIVVGETPVPLEQASAFQVYHQNILPLAPGDIVRITRNGVTTNGAHRLNNGALYSIRKFDAAGDIVLNNGWTVSQQSGFLTQGYVVTSHASQGKTVDRVFIGASSVSHPASSREGLYVAASRGRESARIYTDDKHALMEAVARSEDRLSATELVADRDARERAAVIRRMAGALEPIPQEHLEMDRDRETVRHG